MHGLACATETLTMLEIRQRNRLMDYYFQLLIFCVNQYIRHGCDTDHRDGSTLRSATVVYILRVLNESIIYVCNYVVQMT